MSPIAYTAAIIAVVVVLFVWNRLPVVVVAMVTAMALWATGVLTIGQALGGFGDPAVIFIASLFVVSSGLEVTGVTAWAGQVLIRGAGEESRTRLLLLTMSLVALLTALISVNGAVAALLPVVVVIAVRLKRNSSQLLMPLVFSAHAGSMLALTGTPVNVLVSEAGSDAGVGGFGFFEFALVGVPLLAGTHGDHRAVRKAAPARAQWRDHARRFQPPRQDAGRAIRPRQRNLPDARARKFALCRDAVICDRPRRLSRTAACRRSGGRNGQSAAQARDRRRRSPAAARRRRGGRAVRCRDAPRVPRGGGSRTRRGNAVQSQFGPRRSRDPAALGPHRPKRLSRAWSPKAAT